MLDKDKKKKRIIIFLIILSLIMIIVGILLSAKTKKANDIKILDATYSCDTVVEDFYEDNEYIYSFPCSKSTSIFVLFKDGNKILVTKALAEKKVTIEELEKAGLVMQKRKK